MLLRSIFFRLDIQTKALYWRPKTSKQHIIFNCFKNFLKYFEEIKSFEDIF